MGGQTSVGLDMDVYCIVVNLIVTENFESLNWFNFMKFFLKFFALFRQISIIRDIKSIKIRGVWPCNTNGRVKDWIHFSQ